ncbi:MAG: NAD(P)/FAD-dependent oxidoreductase [Kordiimonadaceae bacterium]|nr:NAD(P)/FAD-dependent oxidoreductase [Kordiimonadaceae bacterium]
MKYDAIIIGAGAAGLLCAITAGKRGKKILLLERNTKPGAKILISGGGRCNFTNEGTSPNAYLCANPHFMKSALSRYTPWDIMDLLARHGATWHEKTLGQLFCDQGAGKILDALLAECTAAGVTLKTEVLIEKTRFSDGTYTITSNQGCFTSENLIIASGGVSIPKMGATDYGFRIARQFAIPVITPTAALVPFTFSGDLLKTTKSLAGVSADSIIQCGGATFRENLLFTHRGLSGPAILQISSYWQAEDEIFINLLPDIPDTLDWLKQARQNAGKTSLKTLLATVLVDRLADTIASSWPANLADMSNAILEEVALRLSEWRIKPDGTEGFKKAEVTKGGVNTDALSSKTMAAKSQPGLYFIGECVDVTGWLGGYNFQWAWASGFAAGDSI